jgi:hypothetical protein
LNRAAVYDVRGDAVSGLAVQHGGRILTILHHDEADIPWAHAGVDHVAANRLFDLGVRDENTAHWAEGG